MAFSPAVLLVIFAAGYFVFRSDARFNPLQYVSADPKNARVPATQGVYLATDKGFVGLYTRFNESQGQAPPTTAPTIPRSAIEAVLYYPLAADSRGTYQLKRTGDGKVFPLQRTDIEGTSASRFVPFGGFEPGEYELQLPTEGLFTGSDYFYFIVQ